MIVTCETCGKENQKSPCHVKRVKHHFCGKECHDKFQSQKVEKICVVCEARILISPTYEKRFSTCSKKCQRANRAKEKNANWNGGVSGKRKAEMSILEYKEWRKAVFRRDNWTCVWCKYKGKEINADHIKPWAFFPELRYDVNNGRTLCVKCHKTTYKDNLKWRQKMVGSE